MLSHHSGWVLTIAQSVHHCLTKSTKCNEGSHHKQLTNKGCQEVPAGVSSLSGKGDQDGRVADAGVVVHEAVLLQVDAGGRRAVPRTVRSHSCNRAHIMPCQPNGPQGAKTSEPSQLSKSLAIAWLARSSGVVTNVTVTSMRYFDIEGEQQILCWVTQSNAISTVLFTANT